MKKGHIKLRVADVFTPGGFPTITYNAREENKLEERVSAVLENHAKILIITGPTKAGKTVLVSKVIPYEESIWIQGGSIENEESIWDYIVSELEEYIEIEKEQTQSQTEAIQIETNAGGSVGFAKVNIGGNTASGSETKDTIIQRRSMSKKTIALKTLQKSKTPVVFDDFHYIGKEIQKSVIRALKAPVMYGLPVVIIAIPNRKYDVIEVEREMTGRITTIAMPTWLENELIEIAQKGFDALNVEVSKELVLRLAKEAYGSPYLMQEFCREVCREGNIEGVLDQRRQIKSDFDTDAIFRRIAENSGRTMFDKLKRGPRQRSDRKQRLLSNGMTTDIYGVVMEALKALKPGTEVIQYPELRSQIKSVLNEDPPQRNEITRVLDKIAEISYSDSSSTPVIDWQKGDGLLTITDPFFAFYLKWSQDSAL